MSRVLVSGVDQLPRITAKDVRRRFDAVEVLNAKAFAEQLQDFMRDQLKAIAVAPPRSAARGTEQALARKAAALRANSRWEPDQTAIQRGRAVLLEAFNQPHNLPLREYVALARKSRQQIYKDLQAGKLLGLSVGGRGQRLPDWQLDPVKQRLTQAILQAVGDVDPWTVYRALSEPLDSLDERSPVDAVTEASVDAIARMVLGVLGVRRRTDKAA
jgi:hypothetical protein